MTRLPSFFAMALCAASLPCCTGFGLGGDLTVDEDGIDTRISLDLTLTGSGAVQATIEQFGELADATGGVAYDVGTAGLESQLVEAVVALPAGADVVFVIDTTGSMFWAMAPVKNAISAVMASAPQYHYGVVVFRDNGDVFVSRQLSDLSQGPAAAADAVEDIDAWGGGDFPENVSAGLHNALTQQSWGPAERHIILVGDAPDHGRDTPMPLAQSLDLASDMGVHINTIVAECRETCQGEIDLWKFSSD